MLARAPARLVLPPAETRPDRSAARVEVRNPRSGIRPQNLPRIGNVCAIWKREALSLPLDRRTMESQHPQSPQGDAPGPDDLHELLPVVYEQLHKLAERFLARERADHTLQPTALVHEAYLRLLGRPGLEELDRTRFLTVAATTIRRILIDHARKRCVRQRSVERMRVEFSEPLFPGDEGLDLLALDEALTRFASMDPRKSRLVELRFFGGLTVAEAANVLEISPRVAADDWAIARAWLHRELTRGTEVDAP